MDPLSASSKASRSNVDGGGVGQMWAKLLVGVAPPPIPACISFDHPEGTAWPGNGTNTSASEAFDHSKASHINDECVDAVGGYSPESSIAGGGHHRRTGGMSCHELLFALNCIAEEDNLEKIFGEAASVNVPRRGSLLSHYQSSDAAFTPRRGSLVSHCRNSDAAFTPRRGSLLSRGRDSDAPITPRRGSLLSYCRQDSDTELSTAFGLGEMTFDRDIPTDGSALPPGLPHPPSSRRRSRLSSDSAASDEKPHQKKSRWIDLSIFRTEDGGDDAMMPMRTPESLQRGDGIMDQAPAASPDYGPELYLPKSPVFRKRLWPSGNGWCRFEGWMALSMGDLLARRLASRSSRLTRDDFQYVAVPQSSPILYMLPSSNDRDWVSIGGEVLSIDLSLVKVASRLISKKHGRCVMFLDKKTSKPLCTLLPSPLHPSFFKDKAKSRLVSRKRFEQLSEKYLPHVLPEKADPPHLPGQPQRNCQDNVPQGVQHRRSEWGDADHLPKFFAPHAQHDATIHTHFTLDAIRAALRPVLKGWRQ